MVEGAGKLDIDGGADRAGGQRGVGRLHYVHLADKVGADGAEIEGPSYAAGYLPAVEQGFVEGGAEAAHRDLAGDAGGGGHAAQAGKAPAYRDAGDALHGGGDIGIGEFADILGRDGVDQAGRVALDVQIGPQGMDQAGNGDALGLVILGLGRGRLVLHMLGVPGQTPADHHRASDGLLHEKIGAGQKLVQRFDGAELAMQWPADIAQDQIFREDDLLAG